MSAGEQPKDEARSGREEDEAQRHAGRLPGAQDVPLFLRGRSDGRKGDAQDEKDEIGE